MNKALIIVESPTKIKTLKKILGDEYDFIASNGHVIDLPKNKIGINLDNFSPEYVVMKNREEILSNIKKAAKKSSKIYLASDPDREGESIAWHIYNALKIKDSNCRIEFNEVTESAVKNALKNPRDINMTKVNAQQARRVLDRLVGYKISPLLWKVLGYNTSAGRVQSVSLKAICDLEENIKNFKSEKFWDIKGLFDNNLELGLYKLGDEKVDKVKEKNVVDDLINNQINQKFKVEKFEISKKTQAPPSPLKTSSLQQLASSLLNFSASKTMKIAQSLYEGVKIFNDFKGLITYMRTDSTRTSEEAKKLAKSFIETNYGKAYIGKDKKEKVSKNSQDAHECIRPTYMLLPEDIRVHLSEEQYKLYKLIFTRFIVSRLANLEYDQLELIASNTKYSFRKIYNKITFEGYYKLYKENEDFESEFPKLKDDFIMLKEILAKENETKPPSRYSEASLIKKLEKEGIGRPSTYASIVENLKKREYVSAQEKSFVPTNLGYSITKELIQHFPNIMDLKFTSKMEESLDDIADGKEDWIDVIKLFYNDLEKHINKYKEESSKIKNKIILTDFLCEEDKSMMTLKMGKFGYYLECPDKHTRSIPADIVNYEEMLNGKVFISNKMVDLPIKQISVIKTDFKLDGSEENMLLKKGRFGYYLYHKDKEEKIHTLAIPKDIKVESLDSENGIIIISNKLKELDQKNKKILDKAGKCDKCASNMEIRKGKFGPFLGCSNYPDCKNIKKIPKD